MSNAKQRSIAEFGNPLLRKVAQLVPHENIVKTETQNLIRDMHNMLIDKKLGVGLAAPQIGVSKSIAIIAIRPSEHRPKAKPFDLVIINPRIIETTGRRTSLYEGCISGGSGTASLFAKVPRYKKLRLHYYDERGVENIENFEGLQAHVIQHEVDHLNGILFVDRVRDTKSYMTHKEYLAYAKEKAAKKRP